jgi:hypothetical protein
MGKYTTRGIIDMPTSYTVNGQPATEAEYNAATAAMNFELPSMSQEARDYSANMPFGEREVPGVPLGAQPTLPSEPIINYTDANGNSQSEFLRVRIRVPFNYLNEYTVGKNSELAKVGGIVFPFTPSISYDVKAEYTAPNLLHSNFPINFYQRSSVGPISITGKFTVENADDARVYLATVHLLKSLTKMRFGGINGDPDSGAPPPVCRLDAYGSMLKNVPVVITSLRIELPDSADYFIINDNITGRNSVPTVSTLSITCLPMYSRAEMQSFSVDNYVNNAYAGKGFI